MEFHLRPFLTFFLRNSFFSIAISHPSAMRKALCDIAEGFSRVWSLILWKVRRALQWYILMCSHGMPSITKLTFSYF